jgi:hypothetical protein
MPAMISSGGEWMLLNFNLSQLTSKNNAETTERDPPVKNFSPSADIFRRLKKYGRRKSEQSANEAILCRND